MTYDDILYDCKAGVVTITINRPEVYNAFRPKTVVELLDAFMRAGWDREVGVIVLTGAGEKAFCTGGDQSDHEGQYGDNDARGDVGMPVAELHGVIRDVPKPVIAKVRGYSIGGGNVLATLCDMTIASETAIFGQVGPKMGSVDPGFGTAYLARVIGEKRAREMWYMCRRYGAREACEMGLCNKVVADEELDGGGRGLVRRAGAAQPHRDRHRQTLLQRGHGKHPRHRRPGLPGAEALLRHRRIEGRRGRLGRKTTA